MPPVARSRRTETRWDVDNRVPLNPAVFAVLLVVAALLAGLFVLFAYV